MRVCPVCKRSFEDEVELCPDDGEALIEGAESLPDNPDLAEVVEVAPDEATAIVDLEKLSPLIAERLGEREQRLQAERQAEEAARQKAVAAADPENTGTLFAPDTEELERGATASDSSQPTASEDPSSGVAADAPTDRVDRNPAPPPKANNAIKWMIPAGLIVAGIIAVAVAVASNGEVLTVTTAPPGARVRVDGKDVGQSPLQLRVKAGSHTVELELDGYVPFKDIVDVKAGEGLPFLQPLKALRPSTLPQKVPHDAGVASTAPTEVTIDALIASANAHLARGDPEAAMVDVKTLIKKAPDDPRSDVLLNKVAEAHTRVLGTSRKANKRVRERGRRGKQEKDTTTNIEDVNDDERIVGLSKLSRSERRARSKKAYEKGERFFRTGRLKDAKREFKFSVQLDARFALPHRSIARIYQREGNDKRAAYHLNRYIKLGGPDPDHRVRDWLEKH